MSYPYRFPYIKKGKPPFNCHGGDTSTASLYFSAKPTDVNKRFFKMANMNYNSRLTTNQNSPFLRQPS